ncbi:MAG: aminotransferase class V-fold PLP-dependent enzyme [Clostridia bacterium]|nr:aminotransferase class V-fold PLP-dependent enzyme [Clostridia bacterium]
MIYFDNAATTFPKPSCVLREINFCLKKYCGNPGRSSHRLSLKSSEAVYSTREYIAKMLSVSNPEQVVFTYNATYALNLAIKTFITKKCHILTSDFEHNSVVRPLERLKRELGIEYSPFSTDGDIEDNIKREIRPETAGIVCSIASNVTGDIVSLEILSKIATENGLFLIIDASQAVGHTVINLSKTPCDVLCAPGHKALFGMAGSGFAYFKDRHRRESFIEGGSGSDSINLNMPELLPEAYEAGTLSVPAISSLGRGVRYVEDIGINEIRRKLFYLTEAMYERLEGIRNVRLYKYGCGVVSFNIGEIQSSSIAAKLDEYGICVRGGLHCAPSIHRKLGTLDRGAVRISFSYLNKMRQVDKAYQAIKNIGEEL